GRATGPGEVRGTVSLGWHSGGFLRRGLHNSSECGGSGDHCAGGQEGSNWLWIDGGRVFAPRGLSIVRTGGVMGRRSFAKSLKVLRILIFPLTSFSENLKIRLAGRRRENGVTWIEQGSGEGPTYGPPECSEPLWLARG